MATSNEDPTQGREVGEGPYEDPTQGHGLGQGLYEDPTQGWEGSDLRRGRRREAVSFTRLVVR
jgi:hypothetical protein